jgi:segregation and condensation protein B
MEHDAPETPKEVEQERGSVEPQADGSGDDSRDSAADEILIDGRISGLPPNYDQLERDANSIESPEGEAEAERDRNAESEEGR